MHADDEWEDHTIKEEEEEGPCSIYMHCSINKREKIFMKYKYIQYKKK